MAELRGQLQAQVRGWAGGQGWRMGEGPGARGQSLSWGLGDRVSQQERQDLGLMSYGLKREDSKPGVTGGPWYPLLCGKGRAFPSVPSSGSGHPPTRLAPDSRLNPHRSLLGTGNYDVNVIMAALQGLGLAAVWWDRRRPLSQLALPQVLGLILNLPSPVSLGLLSLPLRRRHWVALRQVDGVYYNLDSKLRAPEALGDEDGVRAFLAAALAQGLCEVLLVVTKEVEEKGCWLRTD
ncbi:PREDICTED: josephin-2 isoform X1 [Propithecus coquereli]|uniref:josephin-2 isoform X1 n=1 Tax=Propithecus coquereli TaxID=379532 RepID=UPI00063FB8D2|nr:PREDICTED: josephin-2 isoform X1 [Propithecus coquereli]